ncbi:hypothetical protein [Ilumatobacter fluminis]|nr:hypothetical protein [Ilumatobacter fluminis]
MTRSTGMRDAARRRWAALAVAALLMQFVPAAAMSPPTSAAPGTSRLVPVGPVRLVDTRKADCGCTRVDAHTVTVDVAGHRAVPDDAVAVAVTITAPPNGGFGHVTAYPGGTRLPTASNLNTRPGAVVANSAIVRLGTNGDLAFHQHRPGGLVVDVTAAFVPATTSRDGRFVPVAPRRLVDTRTPATPSGPLRAGGSLDVALPDGVRADATAVVVNITSVLEPRAGHLSAHPSEAKAGNTSFLNLDGSGRVAAASVVLPVDEGGFTIESYGGGHMMVDLVGWFTGPSAANSDVGLFVPTDPRRLVDTRRDDGRLWEDGTIELGLPVAGASAVVTNLTVVAPDRTGHVTAFPARTRLPDTSSVNAAFRDHTVANMAITRVSTAGLAYRSHASTDLVVDMNGWFTGTPVATTTAAGRNQPPPPSRVLLVGDSTLSSLVYLPQTAGALIGFESVFDRGNCRRLVRQSCVSPTTGVRPTTAVEAIHAAPGTFDIVYIKAGYNDWFTYFPTEFDAVVQAARAKGAHTVLWQSYNTAVFRPTEQRAYVEKNASLRAIVGLPQYDDVHLADWAAYSDPRPDWFWDGIHVTTAGAWAIPDYISRWIAHLERRPCPRPWAVGQPAPDPCPRPEWRGAVPNPISLY